MASSCASDGNGHRIDLNALTGGRAIVVYGQQEVVKDLIGARRAAGAPLLFDVSDVTLADLDTSAPVHSLPARRRRSRSSSVQ